MEQEAQSPLALNRVDPVQRMTEDALAVVLIPTAVMMVVHIITIFLTGRFTTFLVLHALFSIVVAVYASRAKMDWSRAAIAIGSAGFAVALVGGIIVFVRTFSVLTFFELLTNPFIIAAFDALVGGIAVLIVPALFKLYQK